MSVLLLLVSSLILAVASGADIFIDWLIPAKAPYPRRT